MLNVSQVGPLESGLNSYTRPLPEKDDNFQVMNLNMLHGFPEFEYLAERLELIAEQINYISPEIVTLQEVPWTRRTGSAVAYLAKRTGMNYVYLPANGNRRTIFFSEGEAILSKFVLKDIDFKELSPRAGFFEHRVALKATAVTPWGEFNIVSTHLTHGDQDINQGQVHDLFEYVERFGDQTTIIAGDFNALDDSSQIKSISNVWMDTYLFANPGGQGFTCCLSDLTQPDINKSLYKRIDYLFLAPHQEELVISIVGSQTVLDHPYPLEDVDLWVSDHIGILTSFEINDEAKE